MKEMKKLLAYLLCAVMLAGMFQMPVSATETETVLPAAEEQGESIDAAMFFSDMQTTETDENDGYVQSMTNDTGLLYGDVESAKTYDADANYYVYTISRSDLSAAEHYDVPSTFTTEKLIKFEEDIEQLDHSKPLFIASHMPLHQRGGDNEYAKDWHGVILAAAEKWMLQFSGDMTIQMKQMKISKHFILRKMETKS